MHAAVVRSFERPPQYEEVEEPVAGEDEEVVEVLAAALHPRVRSAANGSHYESTGELPLVPGIDGVGRTAAGDVVYFVLPDTLRGSMAQRVAVDRRRMAVLPDGIDPVQLAAAMNPAMSSWIALRQRTSFAAGAGVLVLGAAGSAGSLAVQVARRLGAGEVVAAGRDAERLAGVGADRTALLGDPDALGEAAADADVVLDYLWGTATAAAMPAVLRGRRDRGRELTWVEIGSMAGLELELRSEWLRACRLTLVGSGQGSVSTRAIVSELPALAAELGAGGYAIGAMATPLSDVAGAWEAPADGRRVVLVP